MKWTEEEKRILIDNRYLSVKEVMALLPNRKNAAIKKMRQCLDITNRENGKPWSVEENDILITNQDLSAKELEKLLPNRTIVAIKHQRIHLDLRSKKYWNEDEKKMLVENKNLPTKELVKSFEHRSPKAIDRARMRFDATTRDRGEAWSSNEDAVLKEHGPNKFSSELNELLPNRTCSSIVRRCGELDVKKNPDFSLKSRKLDQNLTFGDLDEITTQVLMGSILGDGSIVKKRGNNAYSFSESHCWEQKNYVIWKQQQLKVFCPSYDESYAPSIKTSAHIIFNPWREYMYGPNGKYRISQEIIDKLNLFGLMIWYLDDGHLGRSKEGLKPTGKQRRTYPHVTAKGFDIDSLQNIANSLNDRYGLHIYIRQNRHCTGMNKLFMLNKDKNKIMPIWQALAIEHNLPECMYYKLNMHNNEPWKEERIVS